MLAAGHHVKDERTTVVQFYPYNRAHTPSSNLHSNVREMSRWAMANMNRGELDGARILKDSTYGVMCKPVAERAPQVHVGISLFLRDLRGSRAAFHNGRSPGSSTPSAPALSGSGAFEDSVSLASRLRRQDSL